MVPLLLKLELGKHRVDLRCSSHFKDGAPQGSIVQIPPLCSIHTEHTFTGSFVLLGDSSMEWDSGKNQTVNPLGIP